MLSLPRGGVGKPHRWRRSRSGVAAISHIDPEPARAGLAIARGQNLHGRVVTMYLARCQHVLTQRLPQRIKEGAAITYSARHGGAIQLHAIACINNRLSIQRLVIGKRGDQDMGQ